MVRVAGAIVNARLAVKVCAEEPESVTLKLSGVAVTGAVGVPLMRPVDAFRARPFGKVPAVNCHVKAPVPPVAARLCEYATPTWPLGKEAVVIIRVAGVIVNVRLTLAVCVGVLESVTLNVNGVAVTATEGVPPIRPEEAFSVKPAGSVPEVNCHVRGAVPPLAASVCE
jgi:hypothetical protein